MERPRSSFLKLNASFYFKELVSLRTYEDLNDVFEVTKLHERFQNPVKHVR